MVMFLSCYLCSKECHNVDEYTDHLRNRHALIEPCSLRCNAGGCRRTFTTYKTLRQHIKKQHIEKISLVDSCSTGFVQLGADDTADALSDITETYDTVHVQAVSAPCVDDYGVSQAALKFLMALMASNSLSLSVIESIRNSAEELIRDILCFLENELVQIVEAVSPGLTCDPRFHKLLSDFSGWKTPFYGIETQQQLLRYLKKKGVYNEAEPKVIGTRWDCKRDRVTNKQLQVEVNDVFYYIPIERTVRLVLQQPESWNLISSPTRGSHHHHGIVNDWVDSDNGHRLLTYCNTKFPASLPVFIQVYFDEVETVNALGSKTGVHKLGAFYFVINNFPSVVNSSLQNIHLLAIAHSQDLKKYTADAVMQCVLEELTQLHDVGFITSLNGHSQHFRCFLTQVVGDNLGLHSLLGYAENFSRATYACDLCMATQEDIQMTFSESKLIPRTAEMYDQQTTDLVSGVISTRECGIKRQCVLTRLPYYHPAWNESADAMHDLFEGVLPLETKLFLHHLIFEVRCISLQELNQRIKSFDYGHCGSRDKPSVVNETHLKASDSSLGQRSAQMMLLFSALPLIVADVILRADPVKLRVFSLLRRAVEVIMAPLITNSHMIYLTDLIEEHHGLFQICYPDRRLLYKHHRMVHYARVIKHSGPLLGMTVMRYEAKHNFAKRLAHVICNFRNISYSVAKRHQMSHCLKWMTLSPLKSCAEVGNGDMVLVSDLLDCQLLIPYTGTGTDIFLTKHVKVFGQEYRPGMTVLLDVSDEGEPAFVHIDRIYVLEDAVYFIVTAWVMYEFSSSLQAYSCKLGRSQSCQPVQAIADYKPFSAVSCFQPNCTYKHITLRHHL